MEPEEAEAVLETIWDLHDKVSDAIHALSRAHFLRAVRRRAGGKAPGVVHIKGVPADGDEAADLNAVAEEARSLHAIRAALEDLEDQFECFLVSLSNPSPYPLLRPSLLFAWFDLYCVPRVAFAICYWFEPSVEVVSLVGRMIL